MATPSHQTSHLEVDVRLASVAVLEALVNVVVVEERRRRRKLGRARPGPGLRLRGHRHTLPEEVRSGQIGSEQVRSGQDKSGQVRSGQVRSGQVRSGQVRSGIGDCETLPVPLRSIAASRDADTPNFKLRK